MLADAIWGNNAYAANNGILQGKTLANGAVLTDGRNQYTLLYAAARLFSIYAADPNTWQTNAASLGFSRFGYQNDAVYGAGFTVSDMIGNDFLLVTLSFITRFDFRPYFAAHGVFYTSLANAQVTANAPSGGHKALGSPHAVLGNQYPKTNLSIVAAGIPRAYVSRNVSFDIGNAATAWPGADNDNNERPEDLVGWHSKSCPGVMVGA
ncbi:hypothetical protein BU23DRAFT_565651 [Bimuria novae-zelandiae CBS 107.79]|uniref:Uncharacterized protein n=1 Tax=Bimuria novae-zelandiae CBS 107.79 TaxID=1447943 RepID=A0A6A5VIJ4_9PLEO|nr:hypothetical protein BU23DRAFT_565651 [Bimuria novae-zelandiae CBS 107.79]